MSRILLVDDDPQLREMLGNILTKMGHAVRIAADGDEALKQCHEEEPEIVITDLIMPGKEGLETIGVLRRQHRAVKIIAMSGGGRVNARDYLKIAKQMGAGATLDKPFTMEELGKAIAAVLA